MDTEPEIKALPRRNRKYTFRSLLILFLIALPVLYFFASGYRFDFGSDSPIVSTGGIYVAADRTDAFFYVDGEQFNETRNFRKAFYAQGLEEGTHRVTVQRENHHTWVKELPVYSQLVTEAAAFNFPVAPQIRVISEWETATGTAVVGREINASTTNPIKISTTTLATTTLEINEEYISLMESFATTAPSMSEVSDIEEIEILIDDELVSATSTEAMATTTKEWKDVKLFESGEDVLASWLGDREDMPYYYCAEEFEKYSTSTATSTDGGILENISIIDAIDPNELEANTADLVHPVQSIPEDLECDPTIRIDRMWQTVNGFDFFPGSADLVLMVLEDGIYVVEVDNRAWQNVQPLIMGDDLDMMVENGQIYVYDEELIYEIVLDD